MSKVKKNQINKRFLKSLKKMRDERLSLKSETKNDAKKLRNYEIDSLLTLVGLAIEHFYDLAHEDKKDKIKEEIYSLFGQLTTESLNNAGEQALRTRFKNMAIGQFVEGLIHCGLQRKPAIGFVAKNLKVGVSTARTANEAYRKEYPSKEKFSLKGAPPYWRMYKTETSLDDLMFDHVKSKQAFKKWNDLVSR